MKKIKIFLVQIANRNLGDTVIFDNMKYLVDKVLPLRKKSLYNLISYNIYSENLEYLSGADAIIFVGGGIIKYKYEKFYAYLEQIIEIADQRNIPVFFNAVGVEGFNKDDERSCRLKIALNKSCVKGITTRDDFETLKLKYIQNEKIVLKGVVDPAIWSYKSYGISANKKSDTVGIGIVRHKIFEDNGIESISREYQLEFWKEVLERLNLESIPWKVFTNGLKADEDFADEVLEYTGYGCSDLYRVNRLTHGYELVKTISEFKGIIACRLHSNIIAYSLQIPSVAIVWNKKMDFWGEKIGHCDRFIATENMNADVVVDTFLVAMNECQPKPSLKMRYELLLPLKGFIRKYAKKRNVLEDWQKISWQNHLVAVALGGVKHLYCNMNTIEGFENSYENGFKLFEVDVRLTSDDELVCVNGWGDSIFRKFELKKDSELCKVMTKEEFLEQKYYGFYETIDFLQLINKIKDLKNINLIIDIGKPRNEKLELFFEKMQELMPKDFVPNIMIRLQRQKDVVLMRKISPSFNIAFYSDEKIKESNINELIDFCLEYDIHLVTMKIENFDVYQVKILHQNNIRVCVFTCNDLKVSMELIEQGADLIGTHYLTIDN